MEDVKSKIASRVKEANNVLVATTSNPNVDQLCSAIALTLILNKLGKHATTVFSGAIPSTIEFLQPEKAIERNTDSLRDFIISLDKSKADKLRYKIEDQFVKIFITPYHTSIGESDLVFSQGDFNVDLIVGLGVHQKEELDQAITSHGRILHDATVATINVDPPSDLGSLNYANKAASSLCEILSGLVDAFSKDNLLDAQISNALLTGIVAETARFSNEKTTSTSLQVSSKLLAAGANQQLVATELTKPEQPKEEPTPIGQPEQPPEMPIAETPSVQPEQPPQQPEQPQPEPPQPPPAPPEQPKEEPAPPPDPPKNDSGTLQIQHEQPDEEDHLSQVAIDEQGTFRTIKEEEPKPEIRAENTTPLPDEEPNMTSPALQPEGNPADTSQSTGGHTLLNSSSYPAVPNAPQGEGDAGFADLPTPQANAKANQEQPLQVHDGVAADPINTPTGGGSMRMVIQPPPETHLTGYGNNDAPNDDDLVANLNPEQIRDSVNSAINSATGSPYEPPKPDLTANTSNFSIPGMGADANGNGITPNSPPPVPPPPVLPPDAEAM